VKATPQRLVRDPKKEHICEESDDDVVLVKDKRGRVIGFERLNFLSAKQRKDGVNIPSKSKWVSLRSCRRLDAEFIKGS